MESRGFTRFPNPTNSPGQFNPRTNNFSNLSGDQKFPFGSLSSYSPSSNSNQSRAEHAESKLDDSVKIPARKLFDNLGSNRTVASKLQEINTLAQSSSNPQQVYLTLTNLILLVLNDNKLEYLVDEILQDLRGLSNSAVKTKDAPLRNHRVGHLPDAAISKLAEIETKLKPYYNEVALWEIIEDLIRKFSATQNYAVLDAALDSCRRDYETRRSY